MAYKVFVTSTFESKLLKQDKKFKAWVENVFDQLSVNPFSGKPLGIKWLREKKFENNRLYFLVFENKKSVYVVNLSTKKDQQKVINSIWLLLDIYKKELEELLNR
jgi:mRNA-degrading endonuclease RelE of RelBE toxin-antitoxin system